MPIYKIEIRGRSKPVLVRAESVAKGVAQIVVAKALSADEMVDALAAGEKVWSPGEAWPSDHQPLVTA